MTVTTKVSNQVEQYQPGEPFSSKELLELGTRAAVDQCLSRLVRAKAISRVSRGVYVRPKVNRYVGEVTPEPVKIVKAKIAPEGETIQVHGAEAARQLQLTTQVATQPVFYTSGSNRRFRVGNLNVKLKHVSPRKLALAGTPAGLALAALWYVGKRGVSPELISKIKSKISPEQFELLKKSKSVMPSWLADTFHEYERQR